MSSSTSSFVSVAGSSFASSLNATRCFIRILDFDSVKSFFDLCGYHFALSRDRILEMLLYRNKIKEGKVSTVVTLFKMECTRSIISKKFKKCEKTSY